MDHLVDNLKNPFEEMYNWCKGEHYDIEALQDSIMSRENLEAQKKKLEIKKREAQTDLDNVTTGKKSVRTIFKNQADTTGMVSSIE